MDINQLSADSGMGQRRPAQQKVPMSEEIKPPAKPSPAVEQLEQDHSWLNDSLMNTADETTRRGEAGRARHESLQHAGPQAGENAAPLIEVRDHAQPPRAAVVPGRDTPPIPDPADFADDELFVMEEDTAAPASRRIEPTLTDVAADFPTPREAASTGQTAANELQVPPVQEKRRAVERPRLGFLNALSKRAKNAFEEAQKKAKDKKAKRDQEEEDEKNKKSSVKKKNPARWAAPLLVSGLLVALGIGTLMGSSDRPAASNKPGETTDKALADAAAMLDGAAVKPPSAPAQPNAQQATAPLQEQGPMTGVDAGRVENPFGSGGSSFTPPASPASKPTGAAPADEDPYMRKLRELKLKGGGKEGGDPMTGPTGLPDEIARMALPGKSGTWSASAVGDPERVPPKPIPDLIEGAEANASLQRDPLAKVAVVAAVAVERSGREPYLIAQIRLSDGGMIAFIYPKNTDPLIAGRWFQVGDQTDDGWTVVAIKPNTVNVISPQGRQYQLHF